MKSAKRFLLLFLAVIFVTPLLDSCSKGEDDPWFSFYTRTNRLCRDWKVLSYRRDIQTNDSIVTYKFDGTTFTYTKYASGYTYISPAQMRILFNKDGDYSWELEVTTDTSSYLYTERGNWFFTGGNDDGDTKNKECVALQSTERTESFTNGTINSVLSYTGSGDLATNVYRIPQLASDVTRLVSEYTTTYSDGSVSNQVVKIKTEIVFESRK